MAEVQTVGTSKLFNPSKQATAYLLTFIQLVTEVGITLNFSCVSTLTGNVLPSSPSGVLNAPGLLCHNIQLIKGPKAGPALLPNQI